MEIKDIITLFNSAGILTIVFYAGKLTSRLESLERNDLTRNNQSTDIAVIKSNLENLSGRFEEMKSDLHELRDGWTEFQSSVLHKKFTDKQ